MPREITDAGWLWDMLDAAQAVATFVQGKSIEDYMTDRLLRSAVEHDYGDLKHDLIWRVATEHVSELITLLTPLVTMPSE